MKNIGASVRQKLLDLSKKEERPFQEVVQRYAMERFLYRLSQSKHSKKFVLKGAMLLTIWDFPKARPTMDVDLLGKTNNSPDAITKQFIEVLESEVQNDGLSFDSTSLEAHNIIEQAEYVGLRINFKGKLGAMEIKMQVDLGFGDSVVPEPVSKTIPGLLDFPKATMMCYQLETSISEKFQTMIRHDLLNSRMKDFFDIWFMSIHVPFKGNELCTAIQATLDRRETSMPSSITAFTSEFVGEKQKQWLSFVKRIKVEGLPNDFGIVVNGIQEFLGPVAEAIRHEDEFNGAWSPDSRKWTL